MSRQYCNWERNLLHNKMSFRQRNCISDEGFFFNQTYCSRYQATTKWRSKNKSALQNALDPLNVKRLFCHIHNRHLRKWHLLASWLCWHLGSGVPWENGAVLRASGDEPHPFISLPVRVCSKPALHCIGGRTRNTFCDKGWRNTRKSYILPRGV